MTKPRVCIECCLRNPPSSEPRGPHWENHSPHDDEDWENSDGDSDVEEEEEDDDTE